jgi:pyruvate formate lyase activating enzyme
VTPDGLVRLALRHGARLVGSSYNEPLITAEWAVDVFRVAKANGLKTAFISNGNATPEVLDYIRPWTDCYKIDFKAMDDRRYRELGGVLQHVLDAIRMVYERGFWLELVTLVVPGFNDDGAQLRGAADFIASVSPEIPWHVTAFHKDYRMTDPDNTTPEMLVRACEIGAEAGLKFVYAGNVPGRVGRWENTWCPDCGDLLVERTGYVITRQRIGADGRCPACGRRIPGVWC